VLFQALFDKILNFHFGGSPPFLCHAPWIYHHTRGNYDLMVETKKPVLIFLDLLVFLGSASYEVIF
jgi:hypothetical protein